MQDKNFTLSKKLKSYSALAGSMLAAGTAAEAQVVYTDVNPDLTVSAGGSYNLDLNNDGIVDFSLAQRSGTVYSYIQYDAVGILPEKSMNAVDTLGMECAHAVDAGFSVNSSLNWVDSSAMALQFPPTASALAVNTSGFGGFGNFTGMNGKFLPLRFNMAGDTYYGWVRLNVASDALSFVVIDYAYKNSPDAPSYTGLTTDVGISEAAMSGMAEIFSNNSDITVKLDAAVPAEGNIVVRNMLGQVVSTVRITGSTTMINLEGASTGAYIVSIEQGSGSYSKRVLIR
jgi:hypothetical protein